MAMGRGDVGEGAGSVNYGSEPHSKRLMCYLPGSNLLFEDASFFLPTACVLGYQLLCGSIETDWSRKDRWNSSYTG